MMSTAPASPVIRPDVIPKLPVPVRVLFGILAVLGAFYALFAWPLILTPIGIFIPAYQYQRDDTIFSISGSLLAISGYFVWASWIAIAFRGRSFLRLEWPTQLVSLINHLGWLVFLPFLRGEYIWDVIVAIPGPSLWLIGNIVVAGLSLVMMRNLDWDV